MYSKASFLPNNRFFLFKNTQNKYIIYSLRTVYYIVVCLYVAVSQWKSIGTVELILPEILVYTVLDSLFLYITTVANFSRCPSLSSFTKSQT
jgi:hypothetical protein